MKNSLKSMINIKQVIILLLCFPVLFFAYYQFQIAQSTKRAEIILDKIDHTLSESQELLKFIGERITTTEAPRVEQINALLKGTNVLALSHLMGAYISWADKSGIITVSGKKGILESDRPSIGHRRYYKEGLKEPWKLHISPVEQSVFSTNYVVPTAMSVANSGGEVVGFLVLGLRLKFLERVIDQHLKSMEWRLVYTDNDQIFGSSGFPNGFEWSSSSHLASGSFVVKTGANFPIKVAVGLTTTELLIRFIKLYFLGVFVYYIIAYLIIRFAAPQIMQYGIRENNIFSANLAQAINSEDKVGHLKGILPHAQGGTKDITEFIISTLEHNIESDEKVATLQALHREFINSRRIQSNHIAKMGSIAQQYLEEIKENIGTLYEDASHENLIILDNMLHNIQQLEDGDLSEEEQSFCSIVDFINQALAINAYSIHEKELAIDCAFEELPEIYIDAIRLESAMIAITKYCVDNSLRSKPLKIKTKNIISDNSKIQITFEVSVVAMNTDEKLALEQLLNISTKSNIFDSLNKTYDQIEKTFELLAATIQLNDFGSGVLKIIISLDLSNYNKNRHNTAASTSKIVALKRVK